MEADLISLFLIMAAALVCPAVASFIPNKIIPETVFLLIAGMVLGSNVTGLANSDIAINLLSDLGLGLLFLLAGYEINVKDLSGKGGRHGLRTWFASFAVALAIAVPLGVLNNNLLGGFAAAIILTTTAYGTLVPIMESRGLTNDTPIGKGIIEYGVWGELCPVLAMTVLLTTRATWTTIALLLLFIAISVASGYISVHLKTKKTAFAKLVQRNAENNLQMSVRAVVLLMIGLITLSAVFDLDVVLGAFAAGFVLRAILPDGDDALERKLIGMGYGFLIPLFFVVSGMKIDPQSVIKDPLVLVLFILALLLIRAVPIFVSCYLRRDMKGVDMRSKGAIALYCTTALPLIVAVTSVAVHANAMEQEIASVLIAAGGITVFLMPVMASLVMHTIDAEMGRAVKEIVASPKSCVQVLKQHHTLERTRATERKHKVKR